MAAGAHFGCPKFTFDRISCHFRSIRNFNFFGHFDKMAAVGHFGCPKFTSDRISGHFRSIWNFNFFLEIFDKMAAIGHFGCPKFTFDRIFRHFRSIRNFKFVWKFFTKWPPAPILDIRNSLLIAFLAIQIDTQLYFFWKFFTKWLPSAILDVRNSLSIAFLAISDRYSPFFGKFLTKWLPSAILDVRNSLSIAFLAILDQYATLIFWNFRSIQNFIGFFRRPFWISENQFRSHFWPFLIDRPYWMSKIHFRSHFWPFFRSIRWPFWIGRQSVIELVRDIWMNNACVKFEERSLNPSKVVVTRNCDAAAAVAALLTKT